MGLSKACLRCHTKKIRCEIPQRATRCSNCERAGVVCRTRKRKHKHDPKPGSFDDSITGELLESDHSRSTVLSMPGASNTIERSQIESPLLTPPNGTGFINLSNYYGRDFSSGNAAAPEMRQSFLRNKGLPAFEKAMLDACEAFVLPSPPVTKALIDNYMFHCDPWTPIVERHWLEESNSHTPSLLLMKAALLAGSRVSEFPSLPASSRELYISSKALIVSAYEQNPIINIIACCLLGWWNQYELGEFSLDTSIHWLRTASGIAYDIGLHKEPTATWEGKFRRRLWWSLVARDCQVSAARGQPTAINLGLSSVLPPSVNDFLRRAQHAALFVAYVEISLILASLCESCQKGQLSNEHKIHTKGSLHRWLQNLPPDLKYLSSRKKPEPSRDNFLTRQLHIIYLAAVSILYCSTSKSQEVSATAILSSSFTVTLLEEFLARDEFQFLTTVFSFYIVSAAVPQIAAYESLDSPADIKRNLEIITNSLSSLSLKWPTARAALISLEDKEKLLSGRIGNSRTKIIPPEEDAIVLFEKFDPDACCHWRQFFANTSIQRTRHANEDPPILDDLEASFQSSLEAPVGNFAEPLNEDGGIDLPFFSLPSYDPSNGYSDEFGAWVFERYLNT